MVKIMIPNKLKPEDEIRVVSPSRSLSIVDRANQKIAIDRLESLDNFWRKLSGRRRS